ncbi:MAG TPA: hypothetical protein VMA35_03370 [Candidatus Sulfopaludibacter sp.]|nr:hypothetical protein [Candidatus Sulfopaludibacter sp.]
MAAYTAAFQTIEGDLSAMQPVREAVSRLEHVQWERPVPKAFAIIATPEGEWNAHALLLKLFRTEILLCRKAGGDEWAVIQQLQASPYTQVHGRIEILLKGNGPREVATEYMAQMRHTLQFMARNAEVKAQKVVWEQFPDDHPGKVVRAISERCDSVAEGTEVIKQTQTQSVRRSRSIGV